MSKYIHANASIDIVSHMPAHKFMAVNTHTHTHTLI